MTDEKQYDHGELIALLRGYANAIEMLVRRQTEAMHWERFYRTEMEKAEAERDKALALLAEARQHIYHLTDPEIDTSGFLARIDAVVGAPPQQAVVDLDINLKGDRS